MRLPIVLLAGALCAALPTSAFAVEDIEWQILVDAINETVGAGEEASDRDNSHRIMDTQNSGSAGELDELSFLWHIDEGSLSPDGKFLIVTIKDGADSVPLDASAFDELDDLTYGRIVDALYKVIMEDVIVSSYSPSGGAGGSDGAVFDDLDDLTYSALVDALYKVVMEDVVVSSFSTSGGSDGADRDFGDLAVYDPLQAAICIGSADCDDLLWTCETANDCEFTCYITVEGDGQACVVGSSD